MYAPRNSAMRPIYMHEVITENLIVGYTKRVLKKLCKSKLKTSNIVKGI